MKPTIKAYSFSALFCTEYVVLSQTDYLKTKALVEAGFPAKRLSGDDDFIAQCLYDTYKLFCKRKSEAILVYAEDLWGSWELSYILPY